MSTTDKLPAWPAKPQYDETPFSKGISVNGDNFPESQKLLVLMYYERARADAWEARCREAVKALVRMSGMVHSIHQADIDETLSRIGPLPEEST